MVSTVVVTPGGRARLPLFRAEIACVLAEALDALGLPDAEVELTLCDDAEIAPVNAAALGCQGPTNVLSFPAGPAGPWVFATEDGDDGREADFATDDGGGEDDASPCLGELVLSLETCRREALLYGQDPERHFLRLLCHGLCHLAGYDHGPEMDEASAAAEAAAVRALIASA